MITTATPEQRVGLLRRLRSGMVAITCCRTYLSSSPGGKIANRPSRDPDASALARNMPPRFVACIEMEWQQDNFTVTTDLVKFDMEFVVSSLQGVWRSGSSRDRIVGAFANSLCFGLFTRDMQIGCVRVVTDREFVSWVCDLFLDPAYRGKKLGEWLMECVKNHPDLVHARLVFSSVSEAQGFYERIGFEPMERGYSMAPRGTKQAAVRDGL